MIELALVVVAMALGELVNVVYDALVGRVYDRRAEWLRWVRRGLGGVLLALGLGGLLCGCAGTRYENPAADTRQQVKDGMECRALAEQGTPPGGVLVLRSVIVEHKVHECLISRGYHAEAKAP